MLRGVWWVVWSPGSDVPLYMWACFGWDGVFSWLDAEKSSGLCIICPLVFGGRMRWLVLRV